MILEVEKIFLTKNFCPDNLEDNSNTNTDVIVYLSNGAKYIASFSTFLKIESQRLEYSQNGKYFWEKNMILIDNCEEGNIKMLVNHLLEEGDFLNVFGLLTTNSTR